ncbi:MAG: hypothetical protein ACXWEY_05110 [Bacteroidia bacterium]
MLLRDIDIRDFKDSGAVEHLFLRKFKKFYTGEYGKVNIYFSDNTQFELSDGRVDILDVYLPFDFNFYNSLTGVFDKKKFILDKILEALLKAAEVKCWETDNFFDAYNECLKVNIEDEWWFKNKKFFSPSRNYSAGLYNVFDLDAYKIFIVLFDKKKNELTRKQVYEESYISFYPEWAKWESDTVFSFKFDGPKKIFRYSIDELLLDDYTFTYKRSTDFFKL